MKAEVTLDEVAQATFKAHEDVMRLHFRAIACHCECLGMNAENCAAACAGTTPAYSERAYYSVMQKWGLINEDGDVMI